MVTLAPELPGALDVVEALVANGVVVSAGHSAATCGAGTGGVRRRDPERDPPVQRDVAAQPPRAGPPGGGARRRPRHDRAHPRRAPRPPGPGGARPPDGRAGSAGRRDRCDRRARHGAGRATASPAARSSSTRRRAACRMATLAGCISASTQAVANLAEFAGCTIEEAAARDDGRPRPAPRHRLATVVSLRDEILEQPDAARRQLASSPDALDALADPVATPTSVESVVIAARGTSDHAAIYAQYLLGRPEPARGGARDAVGRIALRRRAATWVARSSSGSASRARHRTSSGSSRRPLGRARRRSPSRTTHRARWPQAADHVLDLAAGPELAVAATKTYTTSLLAIARLSLALDPDPAAPAALAAVPEAMAAALGVEADVAGDRRRAGRGARHLRSMRRRRPRLRVRHGARVGTQAQGARRRSSPTPTRPRTSGTARSRSCSRAIPVLVLAPDGEPAEGQAELLRDLRERGRRARSSSRTSRRRAPSAAGPSRFPPACRSGCARSSRSSRRSCSPTT